MQTSIFKREVLKLFFVSQVRVILKKKKHFCLFINSGAMLSFEHLLLIKTNIKIAYVTAGGSKKYKNIN